MNKIFFKKSTIYVLWYYSKTVCLSFFVCFCFLGLHLWHIDIPRPGVKLELQLLAYATATATWDLSHICNLHHCPQQRRILNPLSKARDRTYILMDTSWVHNLLSHNGNPLSSYFFFFFVFLPFLGPIPGHMEVPRLGV